MNNNESSVPILSIKTVEKKLARTYTDSESVIKTLEQIAKITHRSLNDVIKELINNFIINGKVYDPEKDKHYTIKEILEKHKDLLEENDNIE